MKNPLIHLTTRQKLIAARAGKAALAAVALSSSAAFAAGDMASAVTALQTETIANVALVVAAAFAVLVACLVPDIGLGLAKKWIKKGAS